MLIVIAVMISRKGLSWPDSEVVLCNTSIVFRTNLRWISLKLLFPTEIAY